MLPYEIAFNAGVSEALDVLGLDAFTKQAVSARSAVGLMERFGKPARPASPKTLSILTGDSESSLAKSIMETKGGPARPASPKTF